MNFFSLGRRKERDFFWQLGREEDLLVGKTGLVGSWFDTRTNWNGPAEQGQGFVFKKSVLALRFVFKKSVLAWWSEEVGDCLVVDLCCLCFWVSCGFWSLTQENDVACERRVGVWKKWGLTAPVGNSGPADLLTFSFGKINRRWIAIPWVVTT